MAKKPNDSTITYYPSFQALAAAAAKAAAEESAASEEVEPRSSLDLRAIGACPRRPVEWLWPGKIPVGKVTLLVGDPGLGKSLVALDVAARVSTGAAWPDDKQGAGSVEQGENPASDSLLPAPGSVLLLTTDDDVGDTIRPRLEAHGANVDRVFFLPAVADLRHDFGQLEAALERLPDCRLIVVDPVNAYVGPSDSHFHTIVRKVLAPLAALAAKRGVAILAVTHLRKRDGSAIQGPTGSMGFVAAARSVWTVCRDATQCRDNTDSRSTLFLPVKNNLGPLGAGLAYTIESHDTLDAPVLRWESAAVTTTVEEAFQPPAKQRGPEAEERRVAGQWLNKALAEGPRDSWCVIHEGKERGFSERTLRRALHAIGGETHKDDFLAGWTWSLATSPESADASPNGKQPGPFAETWPLRENSEKTASGQTVSTPTLPPPPSVEQSIAYLNRINVGRRVHQPAPPPRPPANTNGSSSKTGHPWLDELLETFCTSPPQPDAATKNSSTKANPTKNAPSTRAERSTEKSTSAKKSARSHPRFLREQTPGTSLARRTREDPERCIASTFPPT